jgi:hypothetical protein
MRGAFHSVLVLLFFGPSCAKYPHEVKLADVQTPQVIVLKKEPNAGNIHGIGIRGRRNLDGEAHVSLMLNGNPYKTERLNAKVSFSWIGDWYSETADIRYEPINVKSGELIVEYQFSSLK